MTTTQHPRATSRFRVLALVVAILATLLGTPTTAQASDLGGKISRSEIISRAQYWVDHQPGSYSNTGYSPGPGGDRNYRRDCSGYIDMAWHLNADPNTAALPKYATQISINDLQAGDILDYTSTHVVLFWRWTDTNGSFDYYTFGATPVRQAHGSIHAATLDSWPIGNYQAYRYNNVTDQPAVTTNGGKEIMNPVSGRCLDVAAGSTAAGTAVQLYDCNSSPAQSWIQVGSTLRVYGNAQRCLDVAGGVLSAGTAIQIYDCNGTAAQNWSLRTDGTIRIGGLCLDARNAGTANGTRLQLYTCSAGNAAQQWAGPNLDNGGSAVRNPVSGRCVDVPAGSSHIGTRVQLYDCNGSAAQHWARDGGTIRVYANECLDVRGGSIKANTAVQIYACNGTAAQKWFVRSDGTIRTQTGGLCLDAVNAGTGNGTLLQIYTCTGGNKAQQWTGLAVDPTLTATPAPSISGTARVGSTLTAKPGSWTPAPVTLAYQWLRNGTTISGATKPSYTLTAADLAATIGVRVTGSKTGYTSVAKTSASTAKVTAGTLTGATPKISGTAKVGKTLTAKPGTWKPAGVTFTYQWLRNGKTITGATAAKYKLTKASKGKRITVTVTGHKAGYTTITKTSAKTGKIK